MRNRNPLWAAIPSDIKGPGQPAGLDPQRDPQQSCALLRPAIPPNCATFLRGGALPGRERLTAVAGWSEWGGCGVRLPRRPERVADVYESETLKHEAADRGVVVRDGVEGDPPTLGQEERHLHPQLVDVDKL